MNDTLFYADKFPVGHTSYQIKSVINPTKMWIIGSTWLNMKEGLQKKGERKNLSREDVKAGRRRTVRSKTKRLTRR